MKWNITKESGARFGLIRAGSINNITGVCYTDYQYPNNVTAAPEHMPVGYYWYFRGNKDANKQADYLSSLLRDYRSPAIFADVEEQAGLTPEALRDSVAKFIGRIHANLGVWAGIYTRATVWNLYSYGDPPKRGGVAESALWPRLKLWVARYGVNQPWVYGSKYKVRDWNNWNIWQFSADGNGLGRKFGADSGSIDLNYFNGDEKNLAEFFGGSVDQEPSEYNPVTVIAGSGLNIRAKADQAASKLGSAVYGSTWDVVGRKPGMDGAVWYKVAGWVSGDWVK